MVHVYGVRIDGLPDPLEVPACIARLPAERQEKIARLKKPDDRRRSAGAGLLLQQVLRERGFNDSRIFRGDRGKPMIEGSWFSLSHAGALAICAVADGPVGCDVEKICGRKDAVARRFFTKEECSYLEQLEGPERERGFFRLWTIKESWLKMTGEGLSGGLDSISVLPETPVRLLHHGVAVSCHVREYPVPGYCISVCAEDPDFYHTILFRTIEI